jgi:hypothetical protein
MVPLLGVGADGRELGVACVLFRTRATADAGRSARVGLAGGRGRGAAGGAQVDRGRVADFGMGVTLGEARRVGHDDLRCVSQ